jgi:alpha-glucosidase
MTGVIYHVYLRSFADSNGDGIGDLPGLISRLDYLKGKPDSLGIDAIWISPFFPSPDRDFGYDVADYAAVDPRYGTLADFDRLVTEAHRRGIRVLLDLVFNHTSDQHPWFLESRSSRTNPKRDWYVWQDARPGGGTPNNWQSAFGGRAWQWDEPTGQFYYHLFLKEQPDLNWRNPAVREALMQVVRFWLDRGVDGFRLDVFNAWFERDGLPDNPPALGLRGFDRQHHVNDIDQPEMFGAMAELRRILDSYPDRTSVGELFGHDPNKAASYCGRDKLHMVFNFRFTDCPWRPRDFLDAVEQWEQALKVDGWPCYVLSNHDVSRAVSRYGKTHPDAVAKVAAAMLLTLRGTPFVYYGEEIALLDTSLRRSQLLDPPGRRYWPVYKGRDPNRAPLPWDTSDGAGFTTGRPWLPLQPDHRSRNIAVQQGDPGSVLSFYRSLLAFRRDASALVEGSFEPIDTQSPHLLAYLRRSKGQTALVALNFSAARADLRLPPELVAIKWRVALSALPAPGIFPEGDRVPLAGFQAMILISQVQDSETEHRSPHT